MNELQNKIQFFENTKQRIFDGHLVKSIQLLKKHINNYCPEEELEFEDTQSTYFQMLTYYGKVVDDEKRNEIVSSTKIQLAQICDKIIEKLKADKKLSIEDLYFWYMRKIPIQQYIEDYIEDTAMFNQLFVGIVMTDRFELSDKKALDDFFNRTDIPKFILQSTVSAVTLSTIRFYDPNKLILLIELYSHSDYQISIRALVGLLIVMSLKHQYIENSNLLKARIKLINEEDKFKELSEIAIIQLIKSLDTEKFIEDFEKNILPRLNTINDKVKDQIEKSQKDEISDEEDIDWEKIFENEPEFLDKLQNLTEKQFEGFDVFSVTLGNKKSFISFKNISNWFLPFDLEAEEIIDFYNNPNIKDKEKINKFLKALQKAEFICNSDKYTLCFYLKNVFDWETLDEGISILTDEMKKVEEIKKTEIKDKAFHKRKVAIIQYIQDLYRFFNFSDGFKVFDNIFKKDILPLTSNMIYLFDDYEKLAEEAINLLILIKKFKIASKILEKIIESSEPQAKNYEKLAFCYQKQKKYEEAIENYQKIEYFGYDKDWTYSKIAFCYIQIGEFEKALEYLLEVEKHKPEEYKILTQIAECYINLGDYEQALKYLFKIDYYHPDKIDVLRQITYCSLVLSKFDVALKYVKKVLEKIKEPFDYLMHANIQWALGNKLQALKIYLNLTNFIDDKSFNELWIKNAQILQKIGIPPMEINLAREYLLSQIVKNNNKAG